MEDLVKTFGLNDTALGHLTSSVQFGFISGTFLFAVLTIADRYLPSRVFFACAVLGGTFNLGLLFEFNALNSILLFRFLTGFFLAGIYPVGMKIAADYFEKGLGKSLGFLVGALVIGTAFPHLLKNMTDTVSWKIVLISTSSIAFIGGLLMLTLVPLGPYSKKSSGFEFSAFFKVFEQKNFRSAAFGYFGHMWELYAFWAFVPVLIGTFNSMDYSYPINTSLWSFIIIGIGGLACVLSGSLSQSYDTKSIASIALVLSGFCCLLCPFVFYLGNPILFLSFLVFWGMVVIADSPLFSTLVAQNAPIEFKGTALTIVNCIGFAITIISIQLLTFTSGLTTSLFIYSVLALGPIFGLIKLWR